MRRNARRTCLRADGPPGDPAAGGLVRRRVEVRSFDAAEDLRKAPAAGRIRGSGAGDLVFEEVVRVGRDSDGYRTTNTKLYGFLGIDDVRGVEELIRRGLIEPASNVTDQASGGR